jgi:hypothetical protein
MSLRPIRNSFRILPSGVEGPNPTQVTFERVLPFRKTHLALQENRKIASIGADDIGGAQLLTRQQL